METYAPVAKLTSLCLVLAISALLGFDVHQMDVETAFLNADLKEVVNITIPERIERKMAVTVFDSIKPYMVSNSHHGSGIITLMRFFNLLDSSDSLQNIVYTFIIGTIKSV